MNASSSASTLDIVLANSTTNVSTISLSNATFVVEQRPKHHETSPALVILCWVLIMIFWFSTQSRIPDERHQRALEERREREKRKNDPDRRQHIIEASLITKKVIDCDENKTLTLGDVDGSISEESAASTTTFSINSNDDEEFSQCVICLDVFRKGDIVTWSKAMGCRHVFHEDCLQGWLSNPSHNDCPSCRLRIIHDEGIDEKVPGDDDSTGALFPFVVINGLVSPLRLARDSLLIGSSIDLEDDESSNEDPGELKRVFSFGEATSRRSMLQVAFRRVSSGLYSGLSVGDDVEDEETPKASNVSNTDAETQARIRRTLSEGSPSGRRQDSLDEDSDPELDDDDSIQRPNIFRRTFGRVSSGIYAQLSPNVADEEEDDEVEVELKTIFRGASSSEQNFLSDEEDDIENGEALPVEASS